MAATRLTAMTTGVNLRNRWPTLCLTMFTPPLASSLALTCGCYEDVYAEFEWDNFLDSTTQHYCVSTFERDVKTKGVTILNEIFAGA